MDIVSVLIGSFVSGYIFHLVVSHWPEMKRRFEKQQDVDNAIFNLLDSWGRWFKSYIRTNRGTHQLMSVYLKNGRCMTTLLPMT